MCKPKAKVTHWLAHNYSVACAKLGWAESGWSERKKMRCAVFPVINVVWDITFVLEMLRLIRSGLGVTVVETLGSDEL